MDILYVPRFARIRSRSEHAIKTNEVEIDGEGNLYVSDTGKADGGGSASGIKRPNGLLLDGGDSLLVADFGTGRLFRADLKTGTAGESST